MPTQVVVNMSSKDDLTRDLEKLELTNDEAERLTKAFKNEEFRKLFAEYAEEIADPENRKKYEADIAMMEGERGMDVKFVHPNPGYVIKTTIDGSTKTFINVSQNDAINKPSSSMATRPDGKRGMQWSIPHSFAPPKEDRDKQGSICKVIDFVVNPDTYRMAETNYQFKKMIEDTAFDGIERQFEVKLDRKNVKYPKIKYKGTPTSTVIRTRNDDIEPTEKEKDDILSDFPYPYDNLTSEEKSEKNEAELTKREEKKKEQEKKTKQAEQKKPDDATVPKYTITHRNEFDIQQFTNSPDLKTNARPSALVVDIFLPMIKSAGNVDLDIFEKKITLVTEKPAKYKLDLNLPYPIDDENGSAKFDKSKGKLTITLPVKPADVPKMPFMNGNSEKETKDAGQDTAMDDSALASMEEDLQDNNSNNPLIQVISSKEADEPQEESIEKEVELEPTKDIWSESEIIGSKPTLPKFSYVMPQYEFHQDEFSASFILQAKNVKQDTVSKSFPGPDSEQGCQVKFVSIGAGGFPIHYSFMVLFPLGCKIQPPETVVDVSAQNVVLMVYKQKDCQGIWDIVHAGKDTSTLEVSTVCSKCAKNK